MSITPSNPTNDKQAAIRTFTEWYEEDKMTKDITHNNQRGGSQPRERTVPCQECRRATWNTSAICDRCDIQDALENAPERRPTLDWADVKITSDWEVR